MDPGTAYLAGEIVYPSVTKIDIAPARTDEHRSIRSQTGRSIFLSPLKKRCRDSVDNCNRAVAGYGNNERRQRVIFEPYIEAGDYLNLSLGDFIFRDTIEESFPVKARAPSRVSGEI